MNEQNNTNETAVQSSTLEEVMITNASGPKKVTGDAGSVGQHSLADQIELDRFLESKRASRQSGLGIRVRKITPNGSI